MDGLEFKSQFNYGKWGNEEKVYQPVYFVSTTQNNGVSYIENTVQGGYNWSLSNTLTYAFKLYNADSSLVNHSFRFLLGHEVLYDFQDTYMTRVENVGKEDARRVLDFLSGATFMIEGNIQKVSSLIYLMTPRTVEIQNDLENAQANRQQPDQKQSFSWLK